jgi:gas vesicle protein
VADRTNSGNGKFVAGAIFGTLLGGLAALLLAPKSGKEVQEGLKQRAKKVVKPADTQLDTIEVELEDQIHNLKVAARDLRGPDYEDSQRLITRAEILKNDLQDSAGRLAGTGRNAKHAATADAKRLVVEGEEVLSELERMTTKLMSPDVASGDGPDQRPQN